MTVRGAPAPACVAVGLATFGLAAGALASRQPWPVEQQGAEKLEYLRRHKDAYTLVAVGSSKTFRSVVPDLLEERLAQRGRAARVFNLGLPGTGAYETDLLVRTVLAMRPAALTTVLVEVGDFDPRIRDEVRLSRKTVHWHDLRGTRAALGMCATYPGLSPKERLTAAADHLVHALWKLSSFGLAPELAARALDPPVLAPWLTRNAGYRSLESLPSPETPARRLHFQEHVDGYERQVAARVERGGEPRTDVFSIAALRATAARLEASGVGAVFLWPPGAPDALDPGGLAPHLPALLAYDDPARHALLYEAEARYDAEHLSEGGARVFTRLLASDLAPLLPR